jgi:hypothetical protein
LLLFLEKEGLALRRHSRADLSIAEPLEEDRFPAPGQPPSVSVTGRTCALCPPPGPLRHAWRVVRRQEEAYIPITLYAIHEE